MASEYRFTLVDTVRTSDKAAGQFVEMIRANKLKPGDKLPSEQVLAQMMGISRATVREALSGLKALGLVVSHSGKGNFVVEDDSDLRNWDKLVAEIRHRSVFLDAIEARRALEGEVCFLATQRATEEQLQEVERALERCKNVTSVADWREADYSFHHSLALASGNQLFIRFIEECFVSLSTRYFDIVRGSETLLESYKEHCSIVLALRERNAKKAREKMTAHVETLRHNFLSATIAKGGQLSEEG